MTKEFLRTLKALVQVVSVSRDERAVADHVLACCRRMGAHAKEDQAFKTIGGNAGNITAFPKGTAPSAAHTLFVSHLDTVGVGAKGVFKMDRKRLKAAGNYPIGIDNRLGVALMLELLRTVPGPYACAFTVQEEIGMFGAAALAIPKSIRRIFVLDGSREPGHFVLSTVGGVTFRVTVVGKGSHAGIHPNGGINAIQVASRAIARLTLGMPGKNVSVNIGRIEGGTASNVVAARAVVVGEVRANTEKRMKLEMERVKTVFAGEAKKAGAVIEFATEDMFKPYAHRLDSKIVMDCKSAACEACLKPDFTHYRGGSDANVFNFMGVRAVNISIGAHNPHSEKEYADFRETEQAFALVKALARSSV
ncbi:MAG: M20/M25/M40 family metallo-hydrolase [Fibrobacterota bacterium]